MADDWKSDRPAWSPRVPRNVIQRLYEQDARGIVDEELIDEVGIAFLARIQSIDRVGDALSGQAHCPRCDRTINHQMDKAELLRCEPCQWQLTWDDYHRSFRGKYLAAFGIKPFLREFADAYPKARSARDKMILIDTLIHRFHWEMGATPGSTAAKNLIGGKSSDDLLDFLDHLAYGDASTPEIKAARENWVTAKEVNRKIQRKAREEKQKGAQAKADRTELKRHVRQQMLSERDRPT